MAMAISNKLMAYAILLLCLTVVIASSSKGHKDHGKSSPKTDDSKPTPAGKGAGAGGEKIFNVLDYGVKAGPTTDNAINFIKAWKAACNYNGKARLVIPKGDFYASAMVFQGPCSNTAPTVVDIQGTLKTISDISMYTEDFWISFEKTTGLVVVGNGVGTIDGQGSNIWKYKEKGGKLFPISLKFIGVKDLGMSGIHSVNPMGFHISIVECENVRASNMKLSAPEDSPNTDGFHISQSTKVSVVDSTVGTGDDCVGVIHGSMDVLVKNVVCGPGHGFSVGSLGKYDDEKLLKDVVITNCTVIGADNGCRIKTYAGSLPSEAKNITYSNIIMKQVKNPIVIDQFYGKKSGSPSKVAVSNVKFINIKGTSTSEVGVDFQCSKVVPCQGVRMSNIDLKYVGEKKKSFTSSCSNAKVTYDGTQNPAPCR